MQSPLATAWAALRVHRHPDARKVLIEVDCVPQVQFEAYHDARTLQSGAHRRIGGVLRGAYRRAPERPIAEIAVHEGDDVAELILDAVMRDPPISS
jgi:hypothetical protein